MPNNDDVNAILQQLRARTEQRLNSDSAPAAAAEKPAVSSSAGSDADKLLEQLRAQREQKQPSAPAPAPAETAVLPPMPKTEAEETAVPMQETVVLTPEQPVPAADELPEMQPQAENSLPEPGIFAGIDASEEVDEAALREQMRAEKAKLRESRKALINKQSGGEKRGFFKAIGQILLFLVLVFAVILAVLYLLQTLAGIQVINVESIFDASVGAVLSALRLALKLL